MRRLLGLVLTVTLGAACTAAERPTPAPAPAPAPDAASLSRSAWSRLPDAPIPDRAGVIGVWSGRELLVWGGASGPGQTTLHADGAAYDPRSRRWRELPPAPLTGRTSAASVWTGRELIVWGGYDRIGRDGARTPADGAAYDPASDTWRTLAPGPLTGRAQAVATWSGTEMVVIGGRLADGTVDPGGAAYDPGADRWRRLPAPPVPVGHDISFPVAVWAGPRLLVWWPWTHWDDFGGGLMQGHQGIDRFDYDPTTDAWTAPGPVFGFPHGLHDVFWTGAELIIPAASPWRAGSGPAGMDLVGGRSGPDGVLWRPTAHGPVDDTNGPALWTGAALVRISESFAGDARPGHSAAWDPRTDRWSLLAPAPLVPRNTAVVWTGTEILLWGDLYRWDDSADVALPAAGGMRFGR